MSFLSLIAFIPLLGALLLLFVPKEKVNTARLIALVFSLFSLFSGPLLCSVHCTQCRKLCR